MDLLFATAGSYPPDPCGGAELSIDEMARELVLRGHGCEVVAGVSGRIAGAQDSLVRLLTGRIARRDVRHGFPVWRATSRAVRQVVAERIRRRRPAVVVTWNRACLAIAREAAAAGVPALVWVPDVSFSWLVGEVPAGPGLALAGSSAFVAGRVRERLGLEASVLRPFIRLDAYEAPDPRPELVTLVNARPSKGVEAALGAAALLPHRRFLLVESTHTPAEERRALRPRLAALPNVSLEVNVLDMRRVYGRTAVLLAPSQVEDASPRVILEAHVNGIPAVASRTGGIPETLGAGGVLLPPDAPPGRWAEALEAILVDPARRAELSRLARANAARAELRPEAVTAELLSLAAAPREAALAREAPA